MSNQVMKVRRETILEWMTCPLCNKLLRDATTISECLHTFCRKCIHKKLSDEELECCPVCNISLGCVPLEKLRPDHNMQDLRAKICPFKRRKVRAPEVAPSLTLPIKRKERSLSSLVVSTPRLPAQTAMTGRRSRAFARKASSLRGSSFSAEKAVKKEEVSVEDLPESSSSPETLNKFSQNLKQSSSNAEMLRQPMPEKEARCDTENWDGKIDLWKPLNHLVEVASRTKSSKYIPQGAVGKPESLDSPDGEVHFSKLKVRQHGTKLRVQNKKDSLRLVPPDSVTPKKLQRIRPKKAAPSREFSVSPQDVLDAVGARGERRMNPIWFSLVASEDQECHAPLPQIPANYLRIKDGNIPVSFIQKYLMRKLDLSSEDEVEIRCLGQPVVPTLQLHSLVDLWLQTSPTSERVRAAIGSSAKDFVMVLTYARKVSITVHCSRVDA